MRFLFTSPASKQVLRLLVFTAFWVGLMGVSMPIFSQSAPQGGQGEGQQKQKNNDNVASFVSVDNTTREDLIKSGKLPYYRNFGQGEVNLGELVVMEQVHFEMGASTLTPSSYKQLNELATWLKSHPGTKVEVQGHTDNSGPAAFNLDFSQKRAESVRKYLIAKGVSSNRITAVGFGESRPRAPNRTSAGRDMNRRIACRISR